MHTGASHQQHTCTLKVTLGATATDPVPNLRLTGRGQKEMGAGEGVGVGDGWGEECFTYKSQVLAAMSDVEFFSHPSACREEGGECVYAEAS